MWWGWGGEFKEHRGKTGKYLRNEAVAYFSENFLNKPSRNVSHVAFHFTIKESRVPQMVHGEAWF